MAASTGAQNYAAVSAISMLQTRDILKKYIDVQNEEGLIDILTLAGRTKATTQSVFHDYTEDALFINLDTTGASVSGSGTTSVTTTFTAATSGYARKGLKVIFPNGKVGQIQSVSTASSQDTVVIKSVDGTNLTHTAGQKLSPLNVMVGEKSTAPASLKHSLTKYYNLIEFSRETYECTDLQIASDVELEFDGVKKIWNRDIANAMIRFKGGTNANLIGSRISAAKFEDTSSTLADPGNGGNQQSSRGLNQYVVDYGVTDTIASPGTLTLADFEDFFNLLTAARAPKSYVGYCSNAVAMKFSAFAKGLNSSGVTSGRLSLDGKEIDFNAEALTWGTYSLQVTGLPIFDHPVFASQTDIVKSMFWVPQGKVAVRGGSAEERMTLRYMKTIKPGFGNEMWEEWDSGALARGGGDGGERTRITHFHTAQALQILGAQHFGKQIILA